jgi:hypothetical protein
MIFIKAVSREQRATVQITESVGNMNYERLVGKLEKLFSQAMPKDDDPVTIIPTGSEEENQKLIKFLHESGKIERIEDGMVTIKGGKP